MVRFVLVGLISVFSQALAINCQDSKQLISYLLRIHYSVHEIDDDISQKTITNYIKGWDPSKVYFLQSDYEQFSQNYVKTFKEAMNRGDCTSIEAIYGVYVKRFNERQESIKKFIDSKHDFKIDESLNMDRKSVEYAKAVKELEERWRQRIKFQHLQLMGTLKDDKAIREKLHKRYELAAKRQKEMTLDDMYDIFLDSFASALDPHTDYFSPTQQEDFRISTRLSLEGIGALLRSDDGITTIASLVPGGAASKGGLLKVDDKIVAVAQGDAVMVDVIDMDLREVVKLIRGPGGTTVKLRVRRDGKDLVIPIVREKIQLQDSAAKSRLYQTKVAVPQAKPGQPTEEKSYRIGVVDLPTFYLDFEGRQAKAEDFRSSSRDMAKEIEKLKKDNIDALIVDLRGNIGGSLDEAINSAGLFNGPGPAVQTRGAKTKPYVSSYDGQAIYNGPLIVLIDRQSASASEILAGAIKDYGRGVIIGDSKTFGKGTVQSLNDLDPRLGAIKVTISKFYTPSGSSTQLKGVTSDILLPSIIEQYEVGEEFYDYPLPWEQVPEAPHKQFGMVTPQQVAKLKTASEERVKKDPEYQKVVEAIKKYESTKQERMLVSLKEKPADEKAKEEKEQKEAEAKIARIEKDKDDIVALLEGDIAMQEAVRIATDYTRALSGQELTSSEIHLVNLEERLKENEAKNQKKAASAAPSSKPKSEIHDLQKHLMKDRADRRHPTEPKIGEQPTQLEEHRHPPELKQ